MLETTMLLQKQNELMGSHNYTTNTQLSMQKTSLGWFVGIRLSPSQIRLVCGLVFEGF